MKMKAKKSSKLDSKALATVCGGRFMTSDKKGRAPQTGGSGQPSMGPIGDGT